MQWLVTTNHVIVMNKARVLSHGTAIDLIDGGLLGVFVFKSEGVFRSTGLI